MYRYTSFKCNVQNKHRTHVTFISYYVLKYMSNFIRVGFNKKEVSETRLGSVIKPVVGELLNVSGIRFIKLYITMTSV